MLPYTTGNEKELSPAEDRELRQIREDYENWAVPLSGAIESNCANPKHRRSLGVIVCGRLVISLQDPGAIYVAPEGMDADGVKQLFPVEGTWYGEDVVRKHLTRFEVARETDRGPWMDLLRSWMPEMRKELERERKEQQERLALSFGGGL